MRPTREARPEGDKIRRMALDTEGLGFSELKHYLHPHFYLAQRVTETFRFSWGMRTPVHFKYVRDRCVFRDKEVLCCSRRGSDNSPCAQAELHLAARMMIVGPCSGYGSTQSRQFDMPAEFSIPLKAAVASLGIVAPLLPVT